MAGDWRLSPELREFIRGALVSHAPGDIGTKYVVSVIWSLGGSIDKGDGKPNIMPAQYTLGWIKQEDLARFITIHDNEIGVIAFGPKIEDAASMRRVLTLSNGLIQAME